MIKSIHKQCVNIPDGLPGTQRQLSELFKCVRYGYFNQHSSQELTIWEYTVHQRI